MPPPPARTLQFVGNATTILRLGPFTVLTDPNFLHRGQRAYLGYGLWSRRRTQPAVTVDQLPALDAVVLSHLHGDHWDRVAERGLDRDVPVLTTTAAARTLRRRGFGAATGLRTWEGTTLRRDGHRLDVTATPGRHAPGVARHLLPPVNGTVLDHLAVDGTRLRIYLSGDTLFVDDLRPIPRRFPDVDVAVVHLGGTRIPFGLRAGLLVTMDARQGHDLLDLVAPRLAVPVHHADYGVFTSPLADFLAEGARRGTADRVRVVRPGETTDLNP